MMGILDPKDRGLMKEAVQTIVANDVARLTDVVLTLGNHEDSVDYSTLVNDMEEFMDTYLTLELSQIKMDVMVQDIFKLCHKHGISMPKGVSMLARGMVTMESTLMDLSDSTNMIRIAANHMASSFDGAKIKKDIKALGKKLYDAGYHSLDIPVQLSHILQMTKKGQLKLNLNVIGSEEPITKLDKMVNRIIICILAAALLVGSSLLCTTDMQPKVFGIPLIGFMGYMSATLMGLWLFVKYPITITRECIPQPFPKCSR